VSVNSVCSSIICFSWFKLTDIGCVTVSAEGRHLDEVITQGDATSQVYLGEFMKDNVRERTEL